MNSLFQQRQRGTAAAWTLEQMILRSCYGDLPADVVGQAKRCLLDLAGVAAAGSVTPVTAIAIGHALDSMGSRSHPVRLMFDGRKASPAGGAFVGATMIDSIDAHDGHPMTKGHAGVTILPTLLALADLGRIRDGRALLTSLVVGYEIAIRAGMALHSSVSDYHTSGAWGSLAAAALVSRHFALPWEATRHALGTAEYFGPRSQMMRCVAHPTMVKDGSGWGAFVGVTSALLAADGFTGAPAITVEDAGVAHLWDDLGRRWRILEQYFKLYPVCRWAQPPLAAAQTLQEAYRFTADDIDYVEVKSFHEAIALSAREPMDTDMAQYSLPFPLAAFLVRGRLGADEITGKALSDPAVLRLSRSMVLTHSPEFQDRFPAERWAQVSIALKDGRSLISQPTIAHGNAENPLGDTEITDKYRALAEPVIGKARAAALEVEIAGLDSADAPIHVLLGHLLSAVDPDPDGEPRR